MEKEPLYKNLDELRKTAGKEAESVKYLGGTPEKGYLEDEKTAQERYRKEKKAKQRPEKMELS